MATKPRKKLFNFSARRCRAILRKETQHIMRDVTTLGLIFIMPILMIILFGYAVSGEIRNVPMAVLDMNALQAPHTNQERDLEFSGALIDAFDNSNYFNVIYRHVETQEEIEKLIAQGKIKLGIIIPENYSARFNDRTVANMDRIRIFIDGADPAVARLAGEASANIISRFSVAGTDKIAGLVLEPSAAERGATYQTVIANEQVRQKQFLIPAIISVIVFSIIIVLTASTIVREKERGTIEQLMITPMTKTEFMLGKLAPYVAVGFFDILMILVLSWFLFSITTAGSILLFIVLGMLFVCCALGLGILISTFSTNQGQAIMLAICVIIPSLILCGIIAPVSTMPPVVAFLARLFPLTHFLEITRGVMIKGIGAQYLIPEITSLAIFAIAVMLISILKFKKSLD
jgi:ABC-2 type transport system permease protein